MDYHLGLTFCGFIACFNVAGDQYPPPLLKKKTEHDRTLILTRLQRVPKKKKKKRNQEWENGAFWPYCGFILDSARGMGEGGGGGGCLLLQECRPDSVHDCFAAQ